MLQVCMIKIDFQENDYHSKTPLSIQPKIIFPKKQNVKELVMWSMTNLLKNIYQNTLTFFKSGALLPFFASKILHFET